MSTGAAEEVPRWRTTLLAIPPERRSASQRDLVRGLELADLINVEMQDPPEPNMYTPRVWKILLAGVESFLLGPFEQATVMLLSKTSQDAYKNFVWMNNTVAVRKFITGGFQRLLRARTNSVSIGDNEETDLCAALAFIQIAMIYFSAPPTGPITMPDLYDVAVAVLDVLKWEAVDSTLAAHGSPLRRATLYEMAVLIRCHYKKGPEDLKNVALGVNEVIVSAAAPGAGVAPPWKVSMARKVYINISGSFTDEFKSRSSWAAHLGTQQAKELAAVVLAASEACTTIMQRAVAAAEAEGDDGRLAFAAGRLAWFLGEGTALMTAGKIREVAGKAAAALERARPWLPKTHRQFLSMDNTFKAISRMPAHGTVTVGVLFNILGMTPQEIGGSLKLESTLSDALELRKCAQCGTESKELMACSGCYEKFYCGPRCQVRGTRGGAGSTSETNLILQLSRRNCTGRRDTSLSALS